ncbi:hypothetical protein [Azospirillum sp. TSO35-2]|uniref:hypothetical protein n=1 Tax=Azospirillum sp. TSO35-2 TaxID=716796 RepID=UPI000D61402C|nr:hypothetical protein [Azospirillum sp. TSO35-2]PWC31410.1 hypothetical protein TSO352_32120 [Azospirillum sp. TSO35-2]
MLVTAHSFISLTLRLSEAVAPSAADLAAFGLYVADNWPARHVEAINDVLWLRQIDQGSFMGRFRIACSLHDQNRPSGASAGSGEGSTRHRGKGALQGNGVAISRPKRPERE